MARKKTAGIEPKMLCRIAVDFAMTVGLLLLMTYERIGQGTHEWLGVGLFVLFVSHHLLNRKIDSEHSEGKVLGRAAPENPA